MANFPVLGKQTMRKGDTETRRQGASAFLSPALLVSLCPLLLVSLSANLVAQDFEKEIAPILVRRCLECHSGSEPKGKLGLTTRAGMLKGGRGGPALLPGNAAESEMWSRVEAGKMPPKKPLPAEEKALLKKWIAKGAVWQGPPLDLFAHTTEHRAGFDWWSLQPVRRPSLPAVKDTSWPRNPIDYFVLERLEANGLTPSPEADPTTLIRRVTFDLIGLPPNPSEVEDFVAACHAASVTRQADSAFRIPNSALETLVDRLLASPYYGERWARPWLDIVRFGESNGFEHDELRPNAWPYRDWVIQALNQDLPYDEFVRLQIAGDVLSPDKPGAIAATGFLVAGGYDSVGQKQQSTAMRAVVRQDELEDIIGTLSQGFLGLTVHCARCHDHKFDPIRQTDYYHLSAALAGVHHGERLLPRQRDNVLAARLAQLQKELQGLEAPMRAKILAEQTNRRDLPPLPTPLARWDFRKSLKDQVGNLDVQLRGDAKRTGDGLTCSGNGYAVSSPLRRDITARTLSVWVKLNGLDQRGGAAMSIEKDDGTIFDAIVYGERENRHWMAGSEFFRRSQLFGGMLETAQKLLHFAIVYQGDGTILGYRNGVAYGAAIQPPGPVTYHAGDAHILFGLRHSPPGDNKHLHGTIAQAELFDRPLSPAEVEALAVTSGAFVSEEQLVSRLDPDSRRRRSLVLSQVEELRRSLDASPSKSYAVAPSTPEATFLLARGEPSRPGKEMTPGGVAALGHADFGVRNDDPEPERRRRLADWIARPDNPLLARVMVNRLWQYHFGAGLIETPSDFGFNGGKPSHPELLDWLADEFRRSGWSIKHMHRLIVTSATYRQASRFRPDATKIDASNRLLWRKNPMRLEAESLRDTILAIAGKLNPQMGGPSYRDFEMSIRGATYYYVPVVGDAPTVLRRSIYRTWARSGRNPFLDTLDCPDPSTLTPRRAVTTTPLQALVFLNNEFMLRMADHWAARIKNDAGGDIPAQVARAYALALGRPPTESELNSARRIVADHGLAILCRALLNCNEFLYVD